MSVFLPVLAEAALVIPGWAWVADHLLTLVQQYSGGLSEPVMRTSLWQAWRQLVSF